MTVKLQRTGNKKAVTVAMRYKNSKTVAMRCKTDVIWDKKACVTKVALLDHKVLENVSVSLGA